MWNFLYSGSLIKSRTWRPPRHNSVKVTHLPEHGGAPLILYVEDEILIQDTLEVALRDGGYEVLTACNGSEALDYLEAWDKSLIGLVTDIDLPGGVGGWEIGRRARRLKPTLPVIYVSGCSAHEWAAQGVPDSVMIAKPFVATQVVSILSGLIKAAGQAGRAP